jgi:hypothetical protein
MRIKTKIDEPKDLQTLLRKYDVTARFQLVTAQTARQITFYHQ